MNIDSSLRTFAPMLTTQFCTLRNTFVNMLNIILNIVQKRVFMIEREKPIAKVRRVNQVPLAQWPNRSFHCLQCPVRQKCLEFSLMYHSLTLRDIKIPFVNAVRRTLLLSKPCSTRTKKFSWHLWHVRSVSGTFSYWNLALSTDWLQISKVDWITILVILLQQTSLSSTCLQYLVIICFQMQ